MSTQQTAPSAQLAPAAETVSPFMTIAEIFGLTRVRSASTIYAWIALPNDPFPAAVSLGRIRSNGKACTALWVRAEVEAWIERQIAKPRTLGRKSEQVA